MANGKINTKIKDMNIECTDLKRKKLYDFLDKRLVLYFYPKDMTPGCTTESIEFNESLSKIKKLKTNVVGVSRDKINSHEKFIDKYGFNGDYVESQAFGYLAIRSFLNLPISYPKTTGCDKPTVGGILVKNF